ncbi:MAG TPA: hypothetical protein VHD33_01745 [Legionellaceae bacterium]|nr:hypothetical protein [Legionellaceae bacterium]
MPFKITNTEEANAVWERFKQKYSNLGVGISDERKKHYQKTSQHFSFDVNGIRLAKLLQRRWQKNRSTDTLWRVNPNGHHNSAFNHFVNQQKIKRSMNSVKLAQLSSALALGDWSAVIFHDKTLPELALSLFAAEKISDQQLFTILERAQIIKDFPLRAIYSILDDKQQFTLEAQKLLFQTIQTLKRFKPLTEAQQEQFRWLISTLLISEQMFYITDAGRLAVYEPLFQTYILPTLSLGATIIRYDCLYLTKEGALLHLSSGVRDALDLVRFGEEEYVRHLPRLGMQSKADIEYGIINLARYSALNYPETVSYPERIHEYTDSLALEVMSHDQYHATTLSALPKIVLRGMRRLVEVTRDISGLEWSYEIWSLIDADYHLPRDFQANTQAAITHLFCEILRRTQAKFSSFTKRNYGEKGSGWQLTVLLVIFYLDMLTAPREWLEFNISAEHLSPDFKTPFKIIQDIYPLLTQNDIKMQILKSYLYVEYLNAQEESAFHSISRILDKQEYLIVKGLNISKRRQSNEHVLANTLQFTFHHKSIEHTQQLKEIARYIEFVAHPSYRTWMRLHAPTANYVCYSIGIIPMCYVYIQIWRQLMKNHNEMTRRNHTEHSNRKSIAALTMYSRNSNASASIFPVNETDFLFNNKP